MLISDILGTNLVSVSQLVGLKWDVNRFRRGMLPTYKDVRPPNSSTYISPVSSWLCVLSSSAHLRHALAI